MTTRDRSILEHILWHCIRVNNDITRFGNDFKIFKSDEAYFDSVSMNLLQIGELVHKLSDDFKNSTGQCVPWEKIYGMRNRFVHGYDAMDDEKIWDTAINSIPALKRFCEEQLSA